MGLCLIDLQLITSHVARSRYGTCADVHRPPLDTTNQDAHQARCGCMQPLLDSSVCDGLVYMGLLVLINPQRRLQVGHATAVTKHIT